MCVPYGSYIRNTRGVNNAGSFTRHQKLYFPDIVRNGVFGGKSYARLFSS